MAEAILNQVDVKNMFDLRGVVAVVTGGGTVSVFIDDGIVFTDPLREGYRPDDEYNSRFEWRDGVYNRTCSS